MPCGVNCHIVHPSFPFVGSGLGFVHAHLYLKTGYTIRQLNIYKVTDTFPKITESEVPAGVGDVSYSIIIGSAESWSINEEELFGNLINC